MRLLAVAAAALFLAGCASAPFPAQHLEDATEPQAFPGLIVSGLVDGGGSGITLVATAANRGPDTYRIPSDCVPAWQESMRDPSGLDVFPHVPAGSCHSLSSMRDFRPGESVAQTSAWNGTLWDLDAESYSPAPAGTYLWTMSFEVFHEDADTLLDPHELVPITFSVVVR